MDQRFSQLIKDSEEWYRLGSEKGDLKKLLSGLYPDKAHFVYELIQNADDALASEITLSLYKNKMEIIHNGTKKFDFDDIKAITGFSISDKDENEKIGKFGIGFKSVYMFTEKPEIISDDYHFSIRHMVIPEIIDEKKRNLGTTTFILPFNNPNKNMEDCYSEILNELKSLEYTCLLFLPHIENVYIEDKVSGWKNRFFSSKDEKNTHLIKLHSNSPQDGSKTDYFFAYYKDIYWETSKKLLVSVAFPVFVDEEIIKFNTEIEGHTYIFFPAINANSNLRFHINAPFASTPDRSSILDNNDNQILMENIGELVCVALNDFKEKNLIDKDLLELLPNSKDSIKGQYKTIRNIIHNFFREEEIIPMNIGGYGKRENVYNTSNDVRQLIPDLQAHKIFDTPSEKVWIKNFAANSKRISIFYDDIEIQTILKNDAVIDILNNFEELEKLNGKNNIWIRNFYELIFSYRNYITSDYLYYEMSEKKVISKIMESQVFLGTDNKYYYSHELYYTSSKEMEDFIYNDAKNLVFINGIILECFSKDLNILENLDFQLFDENKIVELKIQKELTNISKETLLTLFKNYHSKIKNYINIFSDIELFLCEDNLFHSTESVLLPSKYTGLDYSLYFNSELFPETNYSELSSYYFENIDKKNKKKFLSFLQSLGIENHIKIIEVEPRDNPNWEIIRSGLSYTSRGYVSYNDYSILNIKQFLNTINMKKSKLILHEINTTWKVEKYSYPDYLIAREKWADCHPWSTADSTLLYWLKETAWIPQNNHTFVKPGDAKKELTPQIFFNMPERWFKSLFNFYQRDEIKTLPKEFKDKALKYLNEGIDILNALETGVRIIR